MVGCLARALAPLHEAAAAAAAAPPRPGATARWPQVELNRVLMGAAVDALVSVYLGVDARLEAGFQPERLGAEAGEAAEVVQQFVDKVGFPVFIDAGMACPRCCASSLASPAPQPHPTAPQPHP
jgi:hypothetical protein